MDRNSYFAESYQANTFLDEINLKLENVTTTLRELIENVDFSPEPINSSVIHSLETETGHLKENVKSLLTFTHQLKESEVKVRDELKCIQNKFDTIQVKWMDQQEYIGKLQNELRNTRLQLQQQSTFSTALGSILGNFVWKATKEKSVVQLILAGNKVNEFFCIVSGSLLSFIETYKTELPEQHTDEMQFMITLVGIVTNIVAYPDGRQLLITDPNGSELLHQLIAILPNIPSPSGNILIRTILMVLFNVSINHRGLTIIQQNNNLLKSLVWLIDQTKKPSQLKIIALKLLHSIVYEITNPKVLSSLLSNISIQKLQEWEIKNDYKSFVIIKDIKENLLSAEKEMNKHDFQQ